METTKLVIKEALNMYNRELYGKEGVVDTFPDDIEPKVYHKYYTRAKLKLTLLN